MVKEIIQIGNPKLNKKSKEIPLKEIESTKVKKLIQDLLDSANKDKKETAGLSAVQIGTLKKVYLVRRVDLEENTDATPLWKVMINPEVKILGEGKSIIWEGCMSIGTGKGRLFGPVERPDDVEVSYYNLNGKKQFLKAEGYLAHIIQHEQDHLNGILFIKYINNPENIWRAEDLDEYIGEYSHYPPIK